MKDLFTDANFPKTADGRVYHLGLRAGEIANRIVTVGSSSRAESISQFLDSSSAAFKLTSERGFLTITGRYKGVPISIVSIGMGYPNMDFFVREARECLTGDMVVIRLGSCGGLTDLPVGSVVVPYQSVGINRNYNFKFGREEGGTNKEPYIISTPAKADPELHDSLAKTLLKHRPSNLANVVEPNSVNASADSFYSSQGRQTSFPDHNQQLIRQLMQVVPGVASLEMETFHLFHLASIWRQPTLQSEPPTLTESQTKTGIAPPPPNHFAATPLITLDPSEPSTLRTAPTKTYQFEPSPISDSDASPQLKCAVHATESKLASISGARIRAASAQMIFASRLTQDFISPESVEQVQQWTGRAVLETLVSMEIAKEKLHAERGSVWEKYV